MCFLGRICDFSFRGHLEQNDTGKMTVVTVWSFHVFQEQWTLICELHVNISFVCVKPTFSVFFTNDGFLIEWQTGIGSYSLARLSLHHLSTREAGGRLLREGLGAEPHQGIKHVPRPFEEIHRISLDFIGNQNLYQERVCVCLCFFNAFWCVWIRAMCFVCVFVCF